MVNARAAILTAAQYMAAVSPCFRRIYNLIQQYLGEQAIHIKFNSTGYPVVENLALKAVTRSLIDPWSEHCGAALTAAQ